MVAHSTQAEEEAHLAPQSPAQGEAGCPQPAVLSGLHPLQAPAGRAPQGAHLRGEPVMTMGTPGRSRRDERAATSHRVRKERECTPQCSQNTELKLRAGAWSGGWDTHVQRQGPTSEAPDPSLSPVQTKEAAGDGPSDWGPSHPQRDLDWVPAFQLWAQYSLVVMGIWEVTHWVETPLSVSVIIKYSKFIWVQNTFEIHAY